VDQSRFDEAKKAYDSGDFRASAKGFLAAAGRETEGVGAAYHMAGNSLMRLRRYGDAVTVYGHALRDELYEKRGAVRANLAAALVAQGDYALAVEEYKAALDEPDYDKHYKAFQGQANALCEMGRYEDAALAYRQAALDGDNPDPGKALSNLGMCFLALERPKDAAEAYKAALGFDDYEGKGKATANLGIALTAMGEHEEAIRAFEKATEYHGSALTPQAVEAFNVSREAVEPAREKVEGWSTGEIPPVMPLSDDEEDSAWSTGDLRSLSGGDDLAGAAAVAAAVPESSAAEPPAEAGEDDEADDSAFFTITDDEMKSQDREVRKAERKERRGARNPWTIVIIVAVAILALLAVLGALYFMGMGYPTQSMTVGGMLDARAEGQPVEVYWVAVPATDIDKEMAKLPPVKEYEIAAIQRSPGSSSATVIVTPENGAPLRYEIALTREGVGWKVTGIENDWRSTGGGS
jgi:Tfp pilus assembly protein PilF